MSFVSSRFNPASGRCRPRGTAEDNGARRHQREAEGGFHGGGGWESWRTPAVETGKEKRRRSRKTRLGGAQLTPMISGKMDSGPGRGLGLLLAVGAGLYNGENCRASFLPQQRQALNFDQVRPAPGPRCRRDSRSMKKDCRGQRSAGSPPCRFRLFRLGFPLVQGILKTGPSHPTRPSRAEDWRVLVTP